MARPSNIYYTHQSVRTYQEASIFSNEYTWTILDILRAAGGKGLTAKAVLEEVRLKTHKNVSPSKVYDLLRELYEREWVHRYYDNDEDVRANRNISAIDWGGIFLDKKYDEDVVNKEKKYLRNFLFPKFLEFLEKAMEDLGKDTNTSRWLPQSNNNCLICRKSHEADEFFSSLLDIAVAEFVESYEYMEFMRKNNFSEEHPKE